MSTSADLYIHDEPLHDPNSWQIVDSVQDIRGFKVYASPLHELGTVDEMLVDEGQQIVSAIKLESGQVIDTKDIIIGEQGVYLKEMPIGTLPFVKVYDGA